MQKLGLIFKEASQKKIKQKLGETQAFFLVKYRGVSSPDLTELRQSLKNVKSDIFVVKNSVARRALKESGFSSLVASLEGPCGLVFVKDEPVITSKVLCNFAKIHEALKIESGFLKDRVLDKIDIEGMARLPSPEVLRYQLVLTLKSPLSGLVMVLNGTLRKLVCCLDQIRKKK